MIIQTEAERILRVIQGVVPNLPIRVTKIVTEDSATEFYGLRIDYNPGFFELLYLHGGNWWRVMNGEDSSTLGVLQSQEEMLPYVLANNWGSAEASLIHSAKNSFISKANGLDASRVEAAKSNVLFVQELLEEGIHDDGLSRMEKWTCKGMLKMLKVMAKKSF